MKNEIEVFISSMFLRILESEESIHDHGMLVLEVFAHICEDSRTVVELFINYDCAWTLVLFLLLFLACVSFIIIS